MSRACTCGGKFLDAEDFRDHLPCPGSVADQQRARAEKAEARVRELEEALRAALGLCEDVVEDDSYYWDDEEILDEAREDVAQWRAVLEKKP